MKNKIVIVGEILETRKVKKGTDLIVSVLRLSRQEDKVHAFLTDQMMKELGVKEDELPGTRWVIEGYIASIPVKSKDGKKRMLYLIRAEKATRTDLPYVNNGEFEGTVLTDPEQRTTPNGYRVTSAVIGIDREDGLQDRIPVAGFGYNSDKLVKFKAGDAISASGQFTSRDYKKVFENGSETLRTAYEFIICNIFDEVGK